MERVVLVIHMEEAIMGFLSGLFGKENREPKNITANVSRYDWNNIYDVCEALGCLVGCAADSTVFIPIQDKNESKGWEPVILISVNLDRDCGVNKLDSMEDYKKLMVPDDIARFLLNSPFSLDSGWGFKYEFKPGNPYPTTTGIADDLAKALEKGCKMSSKVQMGLNRYTVEVPNKGTVRLRVI